MFCSGDPDGYPYIVMPGASVVHLTDPKKQLRAVETRGRTEYIPNTACRQARNAAGRFDAIRENERNGRRVCKSCLSSYQNYVAVLANQIHGATMILRGW